MNSTSIRLNDEIIAVIDEFAKAKGFTWRDKPNRSETMRYAVDNIIKPYFQGNLKGDEALIINDTECAQTISSNEKIMKLIDSINTDQNKVILIQIFYS